MTFLTIVFIALILFSLLDLVEFETLLKKTIFSILGLLLTIIASFRYGDRDYLNYIRYYEWVKPLNEFDYTELTNVEIGYLILNSLYKYFNLDYKWVFFTISLLSIGLLFNYLKNFKYRFSALLVFFPHLYLLRDLMQIRAGLTASVLLYSYRPIHERKFNKFLLIVVLASLFHYAAFVFIPFYFIYPWIVKGKRCLYLIVSSIIIGSVLNQDLIRLLFFKLGIERITVYLSYGSEEFKELGLLNPVLIKNCLLFGMIYIKRDFLSKYVPLIDVYLISISIAAFWLAAFNNYSLFAGRTATFFSTIEIILFPCIYFILWRRIIGWVIIVLFSIIAFIPKFDIFDRLGFYFLGS